MEFNAIMLMDLHWGAISPEKMKKELQETLYTHLDDTDQIIHMIAIGGDLFDSKQYLSSDVTKYVLEFLQTLLELTELMRTQIYIVKGTRTHDDLQLQTLKVILGMSRFYRRIHIIEEVTEVKLTDIPADDPRVRGQHYFYPVSQFDNYEVTEDDTTVDILFIPEEYIMDQRMYYKDTLYNPDKHYDFIIGHGMVDKIWYAQKEKTNQSELTMRSSSPVFAVDDLTRSANRVYFGHIHMHKSYGEGNRFQYVGPFTRWEFGVESEVGYLQVMYDVDTKSAFEYYWENDKAQRMRTAALTISDTMDFTTLNDLLNTVIAKHMEVCDKLRLIINLKSNIPNALGMRGFIISKIGEMRYVKLILTMIDDDQEPEQIEEKEEKRKETLGYFTDCSLEERVQKYIKSKKNVDIPIEDIKRILNV